ncbi:cation:proton antiporter [Actinocrispum sp. NPDC049592]|uniref:cation:proton antiporter n=1 Tax=Actinocrispum sp. NPDC049592 TaxID=3154835 RepID=UPI003413083F
MTSHQAVFLLLGLAVVLVVTRAAGVLARRLRQPRVVGEMAAGILLGPTFFHGVVARAVFPVDVRPMIAALANVGVAVFMFIVGLEVDHRLLRRDSASALTVALGSILVPFGLGFGAAYLIGGPDARMPGSALFLGTAMAITAFPVLARILRDRELSRTRIGGLALLAAAVGDVIAWCVLAVVITVTGTQQDQWRAALLIPYLLLLVFAVRPLLRRLPPTTSGLVLAMAGLLVSASATEWMGLHFIFGAFAFGLVMPRSGVTAAVHERVETFGTALLLPVFFVVSGLNADLSGLSTDGLWQLGLILLVAIGGKIAGAYLGARLRKQTPRDAAVLAVLMNTRGLTELIVLAVGLQIGVLDVRLYSLLVVMALVTTAMTGPLLSPLMRRGDPAFLPA